MLHAQLKRISILMLYDTILRLSKGTRRKPVLLLESVCTDNDVKTADDFGLTVAAHCDEQRELITAAKLERSIDIYLTMNSGMNQLGFTPEGRYKLYWVGKKFIVWRQRARDSPHSTVTDLARFRGLSISVPLANAA
jgi:alanine racemase